MDGITNNPVKMRLMESLISTLWHLESMLFVWSNVPSIYFFHVSEIKIPHTLEKCICPQRSSFCQLNLTSWLCLSWCYFLWKVW